MVTWDIPLRWELRNRLPLHTGDTGFARQPLPDVPRSHALLHLRTNEQNPSPPLSRCQREEPRQVGILSVLAHGLR